MTEHYDIAWLKAKIENGEHLKFVCFWSHNDKFNEKTGKFCFSQWHESPFNVAGIAYKTAEHWMMASKALLFGDRASYLKIISSKTPDEAKDLGRKVSGYDGNLWNARKFGIVKRGSIHKFNQHPAMADYLLKTGDSILVEASPVDEIWGNGLAEENPEIENVNAWPGQNLLGFALMEARDFLKSFGHFSEPENSMQAPWAKFPDASKEDVFWKTGKGQSFMDSFNGYLSSLGEREKTVYKLCNPLPPKWEGFYE